MSQPDELPEDVRGEMLRMRTLLDNVGAYLYTKDLAGRYTYVNDLVAQLFGVPAADIVGKDDTHFFDTDFSNELRVNDRRVMDHGETIEREESNYIKATGENRIYWTVKRPIHDDSGAIIGMGGISTDITERKRLEQEVERQRQLLDAIINNVDAYVYIKTRDRRFVYMNQQVAGLFDFDGVLDKKGRPDTDFMSKDFADGFWQLDQKVFESGVKQCGEESFTGADGSERHYWTVKVPISLPDQPQALIGFSTDITELHKLKEELYQQAHFDSLTGVANRRYFFGEAGKEFAKARRYGQPLTVMMLDIDNFKRINDSYGHLAGDAYINAFVRHCLQGIRECDFLGRIGGEEFAILLPNTPLAPANVLAQRLCASLHGVSVDEGGHKGISSTVSIGVAVLEPADASFEKLLERADQALYRAKAGGRDQVIMAGI